jgi:cyclopropane fatty-acyl-phospholipid synthase-like methyltransferase
MSLHWDERYNRKEYVYGSTPNVFFENQLTDLKPGDILLPCEGEGRNALFAAQSNWNVVAFDSSEVGKNKAMALAAQNNVSYDYQILDVNEANFEPESFDVIALIYAHFKPQLRSKFHATIQRWLKPGGKIILEAFNPNQLNYNSGGPKDLDMLYSTDILYKDFEGMKIELIETSTIVLDEGAFHQGDAAVIRFVAQKV